MAAFSQRFNVHSGKQLHALFCGKPKILKAALDETTAKRLLLALEAIGARARVEPDTPMTQGAKSAAVSGAVGLADNLVPSTYPKGLAKKLERAKTLPVKVISADCKAQKPKFG